MVYNTLTGSTSLFIATHPECPPQIPTANIAQYLFRHNTVIIPGDQLSSHKDAILAMAWSFTEAIALPWSQDWDKWTAKAKYLQAGMYKLA